MTKEEVKELYERLLKQDRRAAARLITLVENEDPEVYGVIRLLHRHIGKSHIVGITGSPGSGKSTLVYQLAKVYRNQDLKVGVIAVDPSSPFTGGALLGDRVRMQELSSDRDVFIRSMGTRGALGGLAVATNGAINILDAFGRDVIMVETVGAGQVEVEIVKYAHTSVVVTMPGGGDEIQAIKAGILEIGDIFVVNKADKEEAHRTVAELEMMLDTRPEKEGVGWEPPVLRIEAINGKGVEELAARIEEHWRYLEESGLLKKKIEERMKAELLEILSQRMSSAALAVLREDPGGQEILRRMVEEREIDPHGAADEMIKYFLKKGGGQGRQG